MKIKSFASGSKGNCTYLEGKNLKILIDIGISCRQIEQCLAELSLTLEDIDAILITHTHKDHIQGLPVVAKHTNAKFYIQEEIYKEVKNVLPKEQIEFFQAQNTLKEMTIFPFPTSHDAVASCGFLITEEESSLVYVTDTGYVASKYLKKLMNKNTYFIEANHDEELLMNGDYPYYLKQRVLGDHGHLSNRLTAAYLKMLVGENTKEVILAHLSEKHNTEELALKTIEQAIRQTPYQPKIMIAKQKEETEFVEV